MKRAHLLLVFLLFTMTVVSCSNNELSEASKHGKRVSQMVQILYSEKSDDLNVISDKLFGWREEISDTANNTFCTIERSDSKTWKYYTDNYERVSFEWKDGSISEILNDLFSNYEVSKIEITDDFIKYFISEDSLIYSNKDIPKDSNTEQIKEHWYHFKFPYGI